MCRHCLYTAHVYKYDVMLTLEVRSQCSHWESKMETQEGPDIPIDLLHLNVISMQINISNKLR
jgi:hypothetical protein